ncbi:Probable peptide transporter ptr2 AltName: Full=Peptide permease ptr2 [Serendipita indica DSM 11827]|uniref:Related to PTR2-Di-and tripeptide permease n=1 Tax=Serendipita indica (strain DSM 11827) TaxID=1109443 RepID=G4U2D9_SERID|nr:Probable peptide transporter ptr2 AltName: Full=Peptide permease ptr2 [Serendipita indica DSM 11827]CCA77760.1 related to PTR2-Di-and tripeptide permease [Serendipita indica DSM 11827]
MSNPPQTGYALGKVATIDEKKTIEDEHLAPEEYIPNSENVTKHEFDTLRHVGDRLPITAWLVVIVEFAERWTYYGTVNVFSNYIRAPLPPGSTSGAVDPAHRDDGVAGALGLGQQKSFTIRTFNTFFIYSTPILGGIIADTLLGRYNTIMLASIICLVGHIILVGTASPPSLAHPQGALAGLIVSILIMGVGAGFIKSNVSPMVGEQYQGKLRKETLASGEVVIKSPAVTIQSVYMYYYAAINFGALGAISASFLARDHGYWAAYLLPTCIFLLVPGVLWVGRKNYVHTPPRGSVLVDCVRVIKMASKGKWSLNPVRTYRNLKAADFWEPAKRSSYTDADRPKKLLWDDEFVAEVSRTVKACAVLIWFPVFWLCYSQIDGNLSTVAAAMQLKGTPNDLIQNLNPVTLIVFIPIFDKIVYPTFRRWGWNFTPIKRIFVGFLTVGLAMVYAGALQHFIYAKSPCHDNLPSECITPDKYPNPAPINVWVVSGPYILVGIGEIFASITSLEYAFTKAPKRMKSVITAFAQFQTALSAAINFALTALNAENMFGWLFGSFAIAAWITGFLFFWTFYDLDQQEGELNQIGIGEREGYADEHPAGDNKA